MFVDLKSKLFILLLIFSTVIIANCAIPKWNYYNAGEDWPKSCQSGLQAPLDITGPFKYQSKSINYY